MPDVHRCAVANVANHRAWAEARTGRAPAPVEVLNKACGDGSCGTLTLTSYDRVSIINSVVPDHADSLHVMSAYIESAVRDGKPVGNLVERGLVRLGAALYSSALARPVVRLCIGAYTRLLLSSRSEITCEVTTVSDVLRDKGIDEVALLKVDVERAEMIVLEGVRDEDWPKVRQVAVEVHDIEGRGAKVEALLKRQGFRNVVVTADKQLGPSMLMMHATR